MPDLGAALPEAHQAVSVDQVTLGEVYRLLLAFQERTRLSFQAADDRLVHALTSLVGKELYNERHSALMARVSTLEKEKRSSTGYHRGVVVAMVSAAVAAVVSVGGSLIVDLVH